MTNKTKTTRCETCNYCKYPRTPDDNNGECKCKLMQYKTIDIIVTGGGSPAWCPFNNLTDGNPIVEGGFMRLCCICGKPFDGRGNNPSPVETDGVCCDKCNNDYVIPRRLRDIAIARIQRDADAIKEQIRSELSVFDGTFLMNDSGARYIEINSALVSAQHRERFYVHNCGNVEQPTDRGIILRDILDDNVGDVKTDKAPTLTTNKYEYNNTMLQPIRCGTMPKSNGEISQSKPWRVYGTEGKATTLCANGGGGGAKTGLYAIPCGTRQTDKVRCLRSAYAHSGQRDFICDITTNGQLGATGVVELARENDDRPMYEVKDEKITIKGKQYPFKAADGLYIIRKLSVNECCRLQTLPDNYCRAVSDTQAYKGLGNGWTAEVIIHILQNALKNVPKNEPIVVLSMYDGIGTGRYCIDELGFTNVRYHAYEIDKFAMTVANSNYADIVQHGDAFALRSDNWTLEA